MLLHHFVIVVQSADWKASWDGIYIRNDDDTFAATSAGCVHFDLFLSVRDEFLVGIRSWVDAAAPSPLDVIYI